MRRLLLSAGLLAAALTGLGAQSATPAHQANMPQIPFGQTYKDFQFPLYSNGELNATLAAVSATGITINRAETNNLKIDLYTNGKVTTTISSPKADLYMADRLMRTKNTVRVDRADMEATSQSCEFDLITKRYLMRQNVRVLLKNFDAGTGFDPASGNKTKTPPASHTTDDEMTAPIAPSTVPAPDASPDIPGSTATKPTPAPVTP